MQLLGGQVNPQEEMQKPWRDETHSETQRGLKQGESSSIMLHPWVEWKGGRRWEAGR